MGNNEKRCSITIELPPEKRLALHQLALKTGMTAASIVRSMIYQRLEEAGKSE